MKSYTSGEVAEICDVTSRTVVRWIAAGKLPAFKLPGRGNNRVSEEALVAFLLDNHIPLPTELQPALDRHCVMMASDRYLVRHVKRIIRDVDYITYCYDNGLEAGFEIASKKPTLIIIDDELASISADQVTKQIASLEDYNPTIIVFSSHADAFELPSEIQDIQVLPKPLDLNYFSNLVEHGTAQLSFQ
ncbi:helix-turn-helix domain-containing protein [Agaribacter flavus]|uniref:Helix-turn-helix domain-containing protein n=1 Tax=Agaribacter flavus TaxID=1902781 RepID=A0ABV7FWR6_9ALTE